MTPQEQDRIIEKILARDERKYVPLALALGIGAGIAIGYGIGQTSAYRTGWERGYSTGYTMGTQEGLQGEWCPVWYCEGQDLSTEPPENPRP